MKAWIAIVLVALCGVSCHALAGNVQLMAKLNGAARPSIVGTTTLPEGTRLATDLVCPLMYCKDFWSGTSEAVVHDGVFISKPFEKDGAPLPTGHYIINVVVFADQSAAVISELSALGWKRGNTIAFHFDTGSGRQKEAMDVATFTPSMWAQGNGITPWTSLGKSESKAYFYTFAAIDYRTFINIKAATLGPGDDYILLEFAEAQLDCRPGHPYPSELVRPTVYSYSGAGDFNADIQRLPGNIPVEHGTVLAKAVIGTCDAVRAHAGTVLAH